MRITYELLILLGIKLLSHKHYLHFNQKREYLQTTITLRVQIGRDRRVGVAFALFLGDRLVALSFSGEYSTSVSSDRFFFFALGVALLFDSTSIGFDAGALFFPFDFDELRFLLLFFFSSSGSGSVLKSFSSSVNLASTSTIQLDRKDRNCLTSIIFQLIPYHLFSVAILSVLCVQLESGLE